MPISNTIQTKSQQGFVVVMLLLILTLGVSSFLLSEVQFSGLEQEREKKTTKALAKAKKLIIARMISLAGGETPDEIGTTACPDTDNDGVGDGCGGVIQSGRLPFRSLNIDDLRDGFNERLWYITPRLLDSGQLPVFNIENLNNPANLLTLDGQSVLAVIIAPGPPIDNVQKAGRPSNDEAHYLEGENTSIADGIYTRGIGVANFNDRVIPVTVNDVMNAIGRKVLHAFSTYIEDFEDENGFYPYAENDEDCDNASSGLNLNIGKVPISFSITTGNLCPYVYDNTPSNTEYELYRSNILFDRWWKYVWYAVSPACNSGGACNEIGEPNFDAVGNNYVSLDEVNKKYILFFSGLPRDGLNGQCGLVVIQDQETNINNVCHFLEDSDDSVVNNNNDDSDRLFSSKIGLNDIIIGFE